MPGHTETGAIPREKEVTLYQNMVQAPNSVTDRQGSVNRPGVLLTHQWGGVMAKTGISVGCSEVSGAAGDVSFWLTHVCYPR